MIKLLTHQNSFMLITFMFECQQQSNNFTFSEKTLLNIYINKDFFFKDTNIT